MKEIPLTRGMVALVDDDDFDYLNQWKWSFDEYARRTDYSTGVKKTIRMHREIVKAGHGDIIDHIDGNRVNNQKTNLRIVSMARNNQNRSRISGKALPKGVRDNKKGVSWMATIGVDGKKLYLGTFRSINDAHEAYKEAAKKHFGDFARFD